MSGKTIQCQNFKMSTSFITLLGAKVQMRVRIAQSIVKKTDNNFLTAKTKEA